MNRQMNFADFTGIYLTRQRIPEIVIAELADTAQRCNAFQQQMLLLLLFRVAVMEDAGHRAARSGVLRQVVRIVELGFLLPAVEHLPALRQNRRPLHGGRLVQLVREEERSGQLHLLPNYRSVYFR